MTSIESNHYDLQFNFGDMYKIYMSAKNLYTTTEEILALACNITGAENCSIMMLNGQNELYILNSRGLSIDLLSSSIITIGSGIAVQVAFKGNPLLVENIDEDELYSDFKRERYRTKSFISCPIIRCEKVIGVLNLTDKISGEPFTAEDLENAQKISFVASLALSNLQTHQQFSIEKGTIEEIYN